MSPNEYNNYFYGSFLMRLSFQERTRELET
jgi:hypothetical protein